MPGNGSRETSVHASGEGIAASASADLSAQVLARFIAVNGRHPVTSADDAYINHWCRTVEALCASRPETPDEVRAHMLAERLPIPSYLRSDNTGMLPADYFQLADEAGGVDQLAPWFLKQWPDPGHAAVEWRFYINGQYVCLHSATPRLMQRKDELAAEISAALARPDGRSAEWLDRLHALVDELDQTTAQFTAYDRLRFGGPVSRDTLINDVRAAYPRSDR